MPCVLHRVKRPIRDLPLKSASDIMNARYVVRKSVAIEYFEEGSLVFIPETKRLIRINRTATDILRRMDGKQTTRRIIQDVASFYGASFDSICQDISRLLTDLAEKEIISDVRHLGRVRGYNAMDDVKFIVNHDVSCRIEDPDGAILFNPETDAVQVVNPTGLVIWQALESPRGKREIVEHLMDVCEGVPEDQVVRDVDEFVEKLKSAGFLGEVAE